MESEQVQMYQISKPEESNNKGLSIFIDHFFLIKTCFFLNRKCSTSNSYR
jgi:hypothetical protein